MKLKKYGLHVSSKVNDYYPQRGSDIKRYLNLLEDKGYNPNFIIDNELFNYYDLGYKHKLIKTSYYDGGLKKCHIKKALKIFKKG